MINAEGTVGKLLTQVLNGRKTISVYNIFPVQSIESEFWV
jgi:hypothetical protein